MSAAVAADLSRDRSELQKECIVNEQKNKVFATSDVGGTFTDLVFYEVDGNGRSTGSMSVEKVHTTPPRFDEGVLESISKAGINPSEMVFFAHGSTVVINALTERKGVKTGLITTRGFRDILEIARGDRPDFFNLRYKKPTPFVPRYLRQEISERMEHTGKVLEAVNLAELDGILELFRREEVEAIAICFLHAYANPHHEHIVLDAVKQRWPEMAVVASHQIAREWREYERTNTAVLSAYVQPIAERYLSRLETSLRGKRFEGSMFVMQSNGGIDKIHSVKNKPITMVESGPASGMLGAAILGKLIGEPDVIALDIGGTTAKCSLIDNGTVRITNQYMIERSALSSGYPIMTPVVDIVEIGNGGGSIAWTDEDLKLHVGPKSAGATPGPVAYGLGGTEPTTTDANLMLGRINPDYFVSGELVADMDAVRRAFSELGRKLDLSAEETARGVVRIANNNMVNALKLVSINRGYDTREFTLVAFGGGGPMHGASLAEELSIPRVIIPAHSAVFSAWGMLMSDMRRDYVQTKFIPFNTERMAELESAFAELEEESLEAYINDGVARDRIRFERRANMRYSGQEHTVQVVMPDTIDGDQFAELVESFHQTYEREFTYRLDNPVEVVGCHLTAYGAVDRPQLKTVEAKNGPVSRAIKSVRPVDFAERGVVETDIYDRDLLGAGDSWSGPAVVEESGTTTVILPGQTAAMDDYGNIHIHTSAASTGE